MANIIKCYRCGRLMDFKWDHIYTIDAWHWWPKDDGKVDGGQTGTIELCGKCADGLEDYLDEIWRTNNG